jgi:hypothetical protein
MVDDGNHRLLQDMCDYFGLPLVALLASFLVVKTTNTA